MLKRPASPADLPPIVPLFPLSGALLLPFASRPLNVFEPRYTALVDDALRGQRLVGLIQPLDTSIESPHGHAELQQVGCLGRITHFDDAEDRYFIVLQGICRFGVLEELAATTPYRQARIDAARFAGDFERELGEELVDRERFLTMMREYAEFASFDINWEEVNDTGTADLVNFCCMMSPYGPREKQLLLEAENLSQRAETLIAMAEFEMARGGAGAPLQ